MTRMLFALDLRDDNEAIAEYERWHRPENVWPEIIASIRNAGIEGMDIFRTGNRLVMVMDTGPHFDAEAKATSDAADLQVQAWEELMARFQLPLAWAPNGTKWMPMSLVFRLVDCPVGPRQG
jgi:L-rhamnose mutarotase